MKTAAATLVLLAALIVAEPGHATLRIVVIDVGQGASVLLQRERHGILIDTGVPTSTAHVLERMAAYGVGTLDYLILTHLHPDHAGGYFRIRKAFPEAVVVDNNHPLSPRAQPFVIHLYADALRRDPRRRIMNAPDEIIWRGVTIKAIWPFRFFSQNLNRFSLVLSVEFGESTAIIMGDADTFAEQHLVKQDAVQGPISLLVAGHHGWGNTADPLFLARIRPQVTVISASWQHPIFHPDESVVARLEAASDQLLRTDMDGEVCLELVAERRSPVKCASIPPRVDRVGGE